MSEMSAPHFVFLKMCIIAELVTTITILARRSELENLKFIEELLNEGGEEKKNPYL